ncbi:MAG TPA: hypothetical protein VJ233_05825 [Hyphomicrobiaceae bacterium]|nr:hypothetical protein [Hyphomicrobiaceae bacterium]
MLRREHVAIAYVQFTDNIHKDVGPLSKGKRNEEVDEVFRIGPIPTQQKRIPLLCLKISATNRAEVIFIILDVEAKLASQIVKPTPESSDRYEIGAARNRWSKLSQHCDRPFSLIYLSDCHRDAGETAPHLHTWIAGAPKAQAARKRLHVRWLN